MRIRQRETEPNVFEVDIGFADLGVQRTQIERRLGYPPGGAPALFREIIDEAFITAGSSLAIRAGYALRPVIRADGRRDGLQSGGVFFHTGIIVASELAAATEAALFVCTIGPVLEALTAALTKKGDAVQAYIVDTAASEFAEATAAVLHTHVATVSATRGLGVTNRYSPGYCTWPVAEQHLLFSLLPPGFCGVTLTASALMVPVKSVSGLIGVGEGVERRAYRCDRCGVEECVYRNTR